MVRVVGEEEEEKRGRARLSYLPILSTHNILRLKRSFPFISSSSSSFLKPVACSLSSARRPVTPSRRENVVEIVRCAIGALLTKLRVTFDNRKELIV